MTETGHIFLSYSRTDDQFALKLAADLKNAGVRLWMDRLDIQVGMDWRDAIQAAINSCAAMIAVLSPDYVRSQYCKNELARADELHRRVFPVLLSAIEPEDRPLELQRTQYEDFTEWHDEKKYQSHLEELVVHLQTEATGQVGAVPNAETRYLTSLIAKLEVARGISQYIELSGDTDHPQPLVEEEWFYLDEMISGQSRGELSTLNSSNEGEKHVSLRGTLEQLQRFVLIGDPGAGKTTAIYKLALDDARKRRANQRTEPIPLLLYLSQWGKEATYAEFIRSNWPLNTSDDPLKMLKRGDIRLYLDGLNEMGDARSHGAKQLREWFEAPDAPKYAIVTCRKGDYLGDLRLGETPTVLVQKLDKAQIEQFAKKYIPERAVEFLARILPANEQDSESSRSLLELARNPFMLTALTYVYSKGGDLPLNMGALFRALAHELWNREARRGTTRGISFEEAEAAFGKLAFAIIDQDKSIDVTYQWTLRQLSGRRWWSSATRKEKSLLWAGVNANYVVVDAGQVRFSHQLIQEYFAAIQLKSLSLPPIVKKNFKDFYDSQQGLRFKIVVLSGLLSEKLMEKLLTPLEVKRDIEGWRRRSLTWWQVFIALAGISDYPDDVVKHLPVSIAVDCIDSGVLVSNELSDHIINELLQDIRSEGPSLANCKRLCAFGSFVVPRLIHGLDNENREIRAASIRCLGMLHSLNKSYVDKALSDQDNVVRRNAVFALQANGDKEFIDSLLTSLDDPDCFVRQAAVEVLNQIGDSIAVPYLIKMMGDESRDVREIVSETLANLSDESIVPMLLDVVAGSDWKAYETAAWTLGLMKSSASGSLTALEAI